MPKRKVKHLMELTGIDSRGAAIAYIKQALREINISHETHVRADTIDITQDKRIYNFPDSALKITDIRVKNHMNSKGEYRSIPRLMYEPHIKDED